MTSTDIFLEFLAYRARVAKFDRLKPFTFVQFRAFCSTETRRA